MIPAKIRNMIFRQPPEKRQWPGGNDLAELFSPVVRLCNSEAYLEPIQAEQGYLLDLGLIGGLARRRIF